MESSVSSKVNSASSGSSSKTCTTGLESKQSPPNLNRARYQYVSLSDSEVLIFKKHNASKSSEHDSTTRKVYSANVPSKGRSSSSHASNSTEKARLIDELILEDFELISQSTDKPTSEEATTTTRRESSLTTEEPSSARVTRAYVNPEVSSPTSLTDDYRSLEMLLPEFLMFNISGVAQLDLGSYFVQVSPEVCMRNDCYILMNAPPLGLCMGPNSNSSASGNEQTCDKGTQISSEDSLNLIEEDTTFREDTPRDTSYREKASSHRRRRIFPIEEISENSANVSFRSRKSRENAKELKERLERILESAKGSHNRRPGSRRCCWGEGAEILDCEDFRQVQALDCENMLEDGAPILLPNQVPEQNEEVSPNCTLRLSLDRSEKSLVNDVQFLNPFLSVRDYSWRNTKYQTMWSTINEVEVIDSNPLGAVEGIEENSTECSCCSWLTRFFKSKRVPKATISKNFFVRWRENPASRNSLLRTTSSFF